MSDKKGLTARDKYERLQKEMLALEGELTNQLFTDLTTALITLDALKGMGKDVAVLTSEPIRKLLAPFAVDGAKKSKSKGGSRFSSKKASKIIGTSQLSILDLAKELGLSLDVVKANLAKNSKTFTVSGEYVKVK